MKSSRPLIVMTLCLVVNVQVTASICLSTGDGDWNQPNTWSCGAVPQGGDTVIIQAGHTVSITQNHVYNGAPLHIMVYGVWYFSGGGSKITLPCGSFVEIMVGGLLQPNSNSGGHSETVRICGTTYWYYDEGPTSGYVIWPPIILPIELVLFEGSNTPGGIELRWVSSSESNADRFELFVSNDASSWELLHITPAMGTSFSDAEYKVIDPGRKTGLWYYSLNQVDKDGMRYDEGTIAVRVAGRADEITCMPNPAIEGYLMINHSPCTDPVEVFLAGSDARVFHEPFRLWEDPTMLAIDISSLENGLYVARLVKGGLHLGSCKFAVSQ